MRPVSDAARRRMLAIAAALLAGVVALWAWLEEVGPLPGERRVLDWQVTHRDLPGDVWSVLQFFSNLASPAIAVLLVAAVTAVCWEARGARFAALVPLAAGAAVLTTLLKALWGTTPLWASAGGDPNYPSGHTAFATALGGLLAVTASQAGRPVAAAVLVLVAAAMGPAMVIGGWHLPSDVLAGLAVGVAWLLGLLALAAPREARR